MRENGIEAGSKQFASPTPKNMTERLVSDTLLNSQLIDVVDILKSYNIPLEQWGIGKAKTVDHLVKEILEGETTLFDINGEIIRRVEFVSVDVRHIVDGVELQLVEERQEFKDGRERKRGLTGISEKMKPGENPVSSANRALEEELGISICLAIENLGSERSSQSSPSYPGLVTEYLKHGMRTYLPDSAFKPEGYVESQSDKQTFFV